MSSERDQKYQSVEDTEGGLYDVLLALKQNINKSLNVATLGQVKSVNDDSTIIVRPFPLITGESEKTITCISSMIQNTDGNFVELSSLLSENDVVLVVFLNRNSIQSFKQTKLSQTITTLNENSDLHSDRYGVVVSICYKQSKEEEE